MKLFNQPFAGAMGDELISQLQSGKFKNLTMFVAFAKTSGVLRIKSALDAFRADGGNVTVYVGIDLDGTSYEALTELLHSVDSLNIVHSTLFSQTFHPKIYDFTSDSEVLTIVGSHNLTSGGLWTNFESSMIVAADLSSVEGQQLRQDIDQYVANLQTLGAPFQHVQNQTYLDTLLTNKYVSREIDQRAARRADQTSAQSQGTSARPQMFGHGIVVNPPSTSSTAATAMNVNSVASANVPTAPQQWPSSSVSSTLANRIGASDPILWYATQNLTGGSGNQLDLSKRSKVVSGNPTGTPYDIHDSGYMSGTVEFFGVDVTQTSVVTNLTINYNGIDYVGNTIKYPNNAHANGTWRLQLEGKDSHGNNLQHLYGNGGLKDKIVAFTKISDNYYSMTVHPGDRLGFFQQESDLLGHNGSTAQARPVGIIF